jgi:endonuclease III
MHSFSAVIDEIKMITKTKTTLLVLGMMLAGCSSVPSPKNDTVESIQQKCAVILSSHVSDDQRWQVYNDLLQEYVTHNVLNQADFDRFNAFIQAVQMDETRQLITELMEVTDWGCSNGNYLEEMDLFIREVQK